MNDSAAPAPLPAALEPRSLPRLFDAIFGLERHHAWELFVVGLLLLLPVHAPRVASAFAGAGSLIARASPERYVGTPWWMLWSSLATTAGAVAVCGVYRDGRLTARGTLTQLRAGSWQLLATLFVVELLTYVFSGAAFSTSTGISWSVFLPSIVAFSWCLLAIPASIVEGAAPWTAVARSLYLTRHNFWRVAVTAWIVWFVTWLLDSTLVNWAFSMSGQPVVSSVVDVAVDAFLYPLRGAALAVLYFDCRVRREAYDLEAMLEAVKR